MPLVSKPVRDGTVHLPALLLLRYLQLLKSYPILTKSATSGILSALGNVLAQAIEKRRKSATSSQQLDLSGPLRFAAYGFFITGPLSHYFYTYMEHLIPPTTPFAPLRKLMLDRLVFAPAFLFLFFSIMNLLEGKSLSALSKRLRTGYWSALKMNWKVWTPIQFININFVPMQLRVLFANLVALFWYAYLASSKK